MMEKPNINYSIDALRGLACILVVFIHSPIPGRIGEVINTVTLIAVPFFFMVSGYFCYYDKSDKLVKKFKSKISHILKITMISCIIYFILSLLKTRNLNSIIQSIFKLDVLLKFIFFNDTSFIGFHLWYLFALIYGLVVFYVVHRLKLFKLFAIISILLIFIRIIGCEFITTFADTKIVEIYKKIFIYTGLPFMSMGYFIHKYENILKNKINIKLNIYMLIFISFAINTVVYIITKGSFVTIWSNILVISLFIAAILNRNNTPSVLSKFGKKYSLFIYIMHLAFKDVMDKIHSIMISLNWNDNFMIYTKPIIIVICTFITGMIFYKVYDKLCKSNISV